MHRYALGHHIPNRLASGGVPPWRLKLLGSDHLHIEHLHNQQVLRTDAVAKALLMPLLECRYQCRWLHPPLERQHQGLLSTGIAQLQRQPNHGLVLGAIRSIPPVDQLLKGFLRQLINPMEQLDKQRLRELSSKMELHSSTLAGLSHPVGRQHASHRMQQHRSESKFFGQPACMLPAGTAIGHQYAATDVLSAMQGHTTNRSSHSLDRQL